MANRSRSGRAIRSSSRRVSGSGITVPKKRRLDPSGFDEAEEAGRRAASTDSGYGLRENRRASAAALEAAASTPTFNTPRVASSPTSSKRRSVKGGAVADAQEKKKGTGSAKKDSKPGFRSSKSQVAGSSTASKSRGTMPAAGASAQKHEICQKRKRTQSQSQTQGWAHAASTIASAAKATRSLQTRGQGSGRGRGGARSRGRIIQARRSPTKAATRRTDSARRLKRGASATRTSGRSSRGRGHGRRVVTSIKSDSEPSCDESESQDEGSVSKSELESATKTEAEVEEQAANSSDADLDDTFANENEEGMKTDPVEAILGKGTIPAEQRRELEQTTSLSPADFSLVYQAMQRKQWDIWQQHPMPIPQMPGRFSSDGTPSPPRPMDYPHSLKAQTTGVMDYAAERSLLNRSEENDPNRAAKKGASGKGIEKIHGCQTVDATGTRNLDAPQRKHENTMDELMTLPAMKDNFSKSDRFGCDGTANLYGVDGEQSADQEQEAIWDEESIDSFVWATRETPEYEKSAEEIAGRKAWAEKLELEEKENAGHTNESSGHRKGA